MLSSILGIRNEAFLFRHFLEALAELPGLILLQAVYVWTFWLVFEFAYYLLTWSVSCLGKGQSLSSAFHADALVLILPVDITAFSKWGWCEQEGDVWGISSWAVLHSASVKSLNRHLRSCLVFAASVPQVSQLGECRAALAGFSGYPELTL